jgi:hypothetical protein
MPDPIFDDLIPLPQNQQAYLGAIDFAKRDLLGHLTTNLHLTPQQIAEVRSIPREDLMQLNAFLDRARANNLRITVRVMSGSGLAAPGPNEVYLRVPSGRPPQPTSPMAKKAERAKATAKELEQEANDAGFFNMRIGAKAT